MKGVMDNEKRKKDLEIFDSCEIAEQTLLDWIQVGLTLIGLGFALGSLIAFLRSEHYEIFIIKAVRIIGQLLILVGVISIILALIQHKNKIRCIKKKDCYYKSPIHLSLYIGIMVSLLGIAAFVAILMHYIF